MEDRTDQHEPAIDGHLACYPIFHLTTDIAEQIGKYRCDSQRIQDGQQGDRDQQYRFEENNQHLSAIRRVRNRPDQLQMLPDSAVA